MRRSHRCSSKVSVGLLALVMLMMGLCAAFPVHATAAKQDRVPRRTSELGAYPSMRWQDGRVSDGDGIIGNGSWGADRAPHRHMRLSRARMPYHGQQIGKRHDGHAMTMSDGAMDSAMDGAVTPGQPTDGQSQGGAASREATRRDDIRAEQRSGVLPWIITVLAVLAITLAILAFVPKRKRSH